MARLKARPASPVEDSASRFINREVSWLEFNKRVLEEARDESNPLLERLWFLSIFESNLDEFYMVRVSGLIEQRDSGISELSPDGLTTSEQLDLIHDHALPLRREAAKLLDDVLMPELAKSGISVVPYKKLDPERRKDLDAYFRREVFPLCTPLILFPAPSFPFISNRSLNLAIELGASEADYRLARVKVPPVIPRVVRVQPRRNEFVLLEDLIANNLSELFPGATIRGSYVFRVIRDADVEIRMLEAADLIESIEESLKRRRFGAPVLLECEKRMPATLRRRLMKLLELDDNEVFAVDGLIGLDALSEIAKVDKPSLKFRPMTPFLPEVLSTAAGIFETTADRDILLHHPFDSFRAVELFVESAVVDPSVIGIKQTLYRVGAESPIVDALLDAAENGKQVAAMVELKARFDESNNLVWARTLEQAGVHVTYGFANLKTHCKLCLIVRREKNTIRTYAHIGTGNYNPATARGYTDIGLITRDPDITQDILELFNYLTGYAVQDRYRKLLVAPINLRQGIEDRIRRETDIAKKGGKARIVIKVNSLVDPRIIESLYEAARSGVKVDLIVRGICCLRPGVPGLSENIRVVSIIGRFLEHSRVFYFENGGKPDVLIGSADLMTRNLDRRIEVLAPIERPELIAHLRDDVLQVYLNDNVKARELGPDGVYRRRRPAKGEPECDAQTWFIRHPSSRTLFS